MDGSNVFQMVDSRLGVGAHGFRARLTRGVCGRRPPRRPRRLTMKAIAVVVTLAAATWIAYAQGTSGAPSPVGQSVSPVAASAAERAVERRHEKVLMHSKARAA